MGDELLHFSAEPLPTITDVRQSEGPGPKPDGFWVSVGPSWADWCLGEEFAVDRLSCVSRVVLAPDANILRLTTAAALDDFTDEFGLDGRASISRYSINWRKIAERYDGIIIAPYCWERRMELMWYYGWDCASGCIWNARAIASIETVDLRAADLVAALADRER